MAILVHFVAVMVCGHYGLWPSLYSPKCFILSGSVVEMFVRLSALIQENTCLITGNCFAANEVSPVNRTEICDPRRNSTGWTRIAGKLNIFIYQKKTGRRNT